MPYALFGGVSTVYTLKFEYVLDNDLASACMRRLVSKATNSSTYPDPVHRLLCSERKATRFSNAEDLQQYRQAKGQSCSVQARASRGFNCTSSGYVLLDFLAEKELLIRLLRARNSPRRPSTNVCLLRGLFSIR